MLVANLESFKQIGIHMKINPAANVALFVLLIGFAKSKSQGSAK